MRRKRCSKGLAAMLILASVLLVALLSLSVVAQTAADPAVGAGLSGWEQLVTTILAGTLGMIVAQFIKERLPVKWVTTRTMTWIAYVAAFISAVLAFLVTGGFSLLFANPVAAIKGLLEAGGFMTLAYATISAKFGLGGTAVQAAKEAAAKLAALEAGGQK